MTVLPDRELTLAVRVLGRRTIFRRGFEKQNSTWRYRCVGAEVTPGGELKGYQPFFHNHPNQIKSAIEKLERMEQIFGANALGTLDAARKATLEGVWLAMARFEPLAILYADFYRYYQEMDLVLSRHRGALFDHARREGFRDDPYNTAAGAFRALSEMHRRLGQDAEEMELLRLSHDLQPRPAKAERLAELGADRDTGKDGSSKVGAGQATHPPTMV